MSDELITTEDAKNGMSDATKFRKEVEDLVYLFMDIFDPSGNSRATWKEIFDSKKDDKEFVKYIRELLLNEQRYFSPEIVAFDTKAQPKFRNYKKLADLVGIPLEEYVVMPHMNVGTSTNKEITTPTPIPVGYLHLKRLQQITRKKNKLAINIDKRDQRTGQVTGDDKGGRDSDYDLYALVTIGAEDVIKELYGPRADAQDMKEALYKEIKEGTRLPRLADLPNSTSEKTALNTLNTYIIGASLMSDVVRDDYLLPITVKEMAGGNKINGDKASDYGNRILTGGK